MAEGKEKTVWVFDVDLDKFVKKTKDAKKQVKSIGETKDFKPLFNNLKLIAGSVGGLIIAFKTLQGAMRAVFRAEDVRITAEQFDTLTASAGIAGDAMKQALEDASDGLVDTNILLKEANSFILQFGKSAEKLPELMDIARKASVAFGGTTIEQFQKLNLSIATGSADQLKLMGILVDINKAQREYAKSLGVTVDVLDEAGKRQAILNQVLKTGKETFKDIDEDAKANQDSVTKLMVAFEKLGDTMATVFENKIGPWFKKFTKGLTAIVDVVNTKFVKSFDKGLKGSSARFQELVADVRDLKMELTDTEHEGQRLWQSEMAFNNSLIEIKARLSRKESELALERSKLKKLTDEQTEAEKRLQEAQAGKKGPEDEGVDFDKKTARQRKFETEVLRMQKDTNAKKLMLVQSEEEADLLHFERRQIMEEQHAARQAELAAQEESGLITKREREILAVELDAQHKQELIAHERELLQIRQQANEAWLESSETAGEGVTRAFVVASRNAAAEQQKFANLGRIAVQSFERHATDAFLAVGEGSKTLGEAMKGFILMALADIAESQGRLYLLQGFTNPALFGAGAALIALAGFLRASAGGAGGELAGGGAGAGGGGIGFGAEEKPLAEEETQKALTINFQGDFLDTDETRTRFVEIIREAQDATEYTINRIGS